MRFLTLLLGIAGLVSIYLFKGSIFYDPWENFIPSRLLPFPEIDNAFMYVLGKYIRFILNDLFMFLIVYTLYPHRTTVKLGWMVFIFGAVLLLPLYLSLSIFPSEQSIHFLHHLHRISMNPILMLLLIPAIYLHKRRLLN